MILDSNEWTFGGDRGVPLDKADIKILKVLLLDAGLSCRQISRKVGISVDTVLSRMKKMEQEGVITGYSAVIDHEKLGYELTVVTEITVSKGRLLEMEKEIAELPNVCCVYDVTGLNEGYDVDPRQVKLFEVAERVGYKKDHCKLLEGIGAAAKKAYGRTLPINVDGAIGAIISDMGIDWRVGKALFIMGVLVGMPQCLN